MFLASETFLRFRDFPKTQMKHIGRSSSRLGSMTDIHVTWVRVPVAQQINYYFMKTRRFKATVWLEIPLKYNEYYSQYKIEDKIQESLQNTLKASVDVEAFKEPIEEVADDITSFDNPVGFIAPDGNFYGANSNDLSLAHLALANEVWEAYKDKIDKKNFSGAGIDFDLERMGFIKIRENEVHYYVPYKEPPTYWTEAQCATMLKYIEHIETLYHWVSFGGHKVTSHMFKQMDKFAIMKLFEL